LCINIRMFDRDTIINFLDNFSKEKKYEIPIHVLWTVSIYNAPELVQAIGASLGSIDHGWADVKDTVTWANKGAILVAQEVSLPGESFEVSLLDPGASRAAYMPGYAATKRSDFLSRNVTINFLETDTDIEAQLFRPWAIALSVDGLTNRTLKSTIKVAQYDSKRSRRKEYTFYNAFPTNCEPSTINYSEDTIKSKTVTFAYSKYEITRDVTENVDLVLNRTLDGPPNLA